MPDFSKLQYGFPGFPCCGARLRIWIAPPILPHKSPDRGVSASTNPIEDIEAIIVDVLYIILLISMVYIAKDKLARHRGVGVDETDGA